MLTTEHLPFCLKCGLFLGNCIIHVNIACLEGRCLSGRICPICADASGLTMNKNHKQVVPGNQVWLSFHHVTGTVELGLETGSQSTSAGQR